MQLVNKAHITTANRIAKRYGGSADPRSDWSGQSCPAVRTGQWTAVLVNSATVGEGVRQARTLAGPVYFAATNRESLPDVLRASQRAAVGVMDPQGNIVKLIEA